MMLPTKITGHNTQRNTLAKLFSRNKLPHALLMAGTAGIGKKLVGFELCRTLFCSSAKNANDIIASKLYGGCGTCKECQLFERNSIPDFHYINCAEKDEASSAGIRELLYNLNLTSFFSGKRVVFLDNADFLSVSSANILLKSLEEPRPDTHFILVCANPYRLPITILSRCQILHFNPLNNEETKQIIENSIHLQTAIAPLLKNSLDISEIAYFAHGSLENIESFATNYESWLTIKELFAEVRNGDLSKAVELSDLISKDKDAMRLNIRLLQGLARNWMYTQSEAQTLQKISVCLSNLISAERLIFERNISGQYVLTKIFSDLATDSAFTSGNDSVSLLCSL